MIRKVEHVALMATDMDKSIAFYHDVFEFHVRARGTNATREMAFLVNDDIQGFEIELMRDLFPGETYSVQGVVNHLAFTVDDMEEAMNHYGSKGIQFTNTEPAISIDGRKTIFFYGPNKELLQFVESAAHLSIG